MPLITVELPPLARGILHFRGAAFENVGITSACAGNTPRLGFRHISLGNYPRSRGEYIKGFINGIKNMELPPLARGIHLGGSVSDNPLGITPARAGNTALCPFSFPACWNYPRLRGEYVPALQIRKLPKELPPLTRGILCVPVLGVPGGRITPARARNVHLKRWLVRCSWNYPRLRGEYFASSGFVVAKSELPPLARGIRCVLLGKNPVHGITPLARGIHCLTGNFRLIVGDIVELTSKA